MKRKIAVLAAMLCVFAAAGCDSEPAATTVVESAVATTTAIVTTIEQIAGSISLADDTAVDMLLIIAFLFIFDLRSIRSQLYTGKRIFVASQATISPSGCVIIQLQGKQ